MESPNNNEEENHGSLTQATTRSSTSNEEERENDIDERNEQPPIQSCSIPDQTRSSTRNASSWTDVVPDEAVSAAAATEIHPKSENNQEYDNTTDESLGDNNMNMSNVTVERNHQETLQHQLDASDLESGMQFHNNEDYSGVRPSVASLPRRKHDDDEVDEDDEKVASCAYSKREMIGCDDTDLPSRPPPRSCIPRHENNETEVATLPTYDSRGDGSPAVASLRPQQPPAHPDDCEKKANLPPPLPPRRTVRNDGPSLLSPSFDNNSIDSREDNVCAAGNSNQEPPPPLPPLPVLRRQRGIHTEAPSRPGAVAMRGRGVGTLPVWAHNRNQEEQTTTTHNNPAEAPRHRFFSSSLSFRPTASNVQTAEIMATANAVDNAETVVYATNVNLDRSAKHKRLAFGLGILALLVIAGLLVGLTTTGLALAREKDDDDDTHPWCQQSLEDQDVFAQCLCNNSTKDLLWTQEEEEAYNQTKGVLRDNGVLPGDELYAKQSCEPENQCMVWIANYKRRNITEEEFIYIINVTNPIIQAYSLCMTYLSFDGYNWTNSNGWMRERSYCDWFGIRCSYLARVSEVKLPANGLNGTFPSPLLGHMEFMKELDVSDNDKIVGTIPNELSQATALHVLDLSGTAMNGTVPNTIGQLEILDELVLSNSSFSGTIPSDIANLTRMRRLYLDHNKFNGTISATFRNLSSLLVFRVDDNGLSGPIPNKLLEKWRHLEHINLSNNAFTGPFPNILFEQQRFKYLVSTFVVGTDFEGPMSINETYCLGRKGKRDRSIVVLNCTDTPFVNCSCCQDEIYCADDYGDDGDFPPSLLDAID